MSTIYRHLGFIIVLTIFGFSNLIAGTLGNRDPMFGQNGSVSIPTESFDSCECFVMLPDGGFFAGATGVRAGRRVLVLKRFDRRGKPVQSWGTAGTVIIDPDLGLGVKTLTIQHLADAGNNQILVVGSTFVSYDLPLRRSNAFAIRVNYSGTIDTAFGTNGKFLFSLPEYSRAIASVARQADGAFLVLTTGRVLENSVLLFRITSNGILDTSFGDAGTAIVPAPNSVGKLAVQPDGGIIVAVNQEEYFVDQESILHTRLLRYSPNGSIDGGFGINGQTDANIRRFNILESITVLPNGKILISGHSYDQVWIPTTMFIQQFSPNGHLDPEFAAGGQYLRERSRAGGVSLLPDGKFYVAVDDLDAGSERIGSIWRFNSNGTLDNSFSEDGKSQLIAGFITGNSTLYLQSDGGLLFGRYGRYSTRMFTKTDAIGDFDFDGRSDAAIYRPETLEWWVRSSGTGTASVRNFGVADAVAVPADYTGDEKTDLAVFRPSTGEWLVLRSEDSTYFSVQYGISGDVPIVGDYDGDMKADAAVFRPSNKVWYFRNSRIGPTDYQYGITGDTPIGGDFDGDQVADIAVFRQSAGEWWIAFATGRAEHHRFGQSGDIPVAADYDADGKDDVAVWRPSTGEWIVRRSGDGTFVFAPFGLPGDIPVVSDFDGDGKSDFSVFRPSESKWYSRQSSAGHSEWYFGVPTDQIIFGKSTYGN